MPKKLYKCLKCGEYTLHDDFCPKCGGIVSIAHPPRFSPVDKYGKYRRLLLSYRKEKKDSGDVNYAV
ncbi:MAG: RNA-protein complex protein Nop10 [Candidatus Njordarchaeales archaeon]